MKGGRSAAPTAVGNLAVSPNAPTTTCRQWHAAVLGESQGSYRWRAAVAKGRLRLGCVRRGCPPPLGTPSRIRVRCSPRRQRERRPHWRLSFFLIDRWLDRTSLRLAHLFDHLVGASNERKGKSQGS